MGLWVGRGMYTYYTHTTTNITGLSWIDNDGLANYYATCFYTLTDDDTKALECAERSLKAGYSDNHNWMNNTDGQINVGALRDDLRFLQLMQRYNSIFGK